MVIYDNFLDSSVLKFDIEQHPRSMIYAGIKYSRKLLFRCICLFLKNFRRYLNFRILDQNLKLLFHRNHLALIILLNIIWLLILNYPRINMINMRPIPKVRLHYHQSIGPFQANRPANQMSILVNILLRFVHPALIRCPVHLILFTFAYSSALFVLFERIVC